MKLIDEVKKCNSLDKNFTYYKNKNAKKENLKLADIFDIQLLENDKLLAE